MFSAVLYGPPQVLVVWLQPSLTRESVPLASLKSPPETEEKLPLAVFCSPPETEEPRSLAVLSRPPETEEPRPLAVFKYPPETEVHVRKVRFKSVGKMGKAVLRYDPATGCYSDPPGMQECMSGIVPD